MNAKTGEIYALASRGDYDLNDYLGLSDEVQAEIDKITDPDEKAEATK